MEIWSLIGLGRSSSLPTPSVIRNTRGAEIFQKSRNHVKILDIRWVKLHAYATQILGATVQYLVTMVMLRLGFVQPCAVHP